ncbi:hypothetical protein [Gramella sp. AN32]|uniref:DUF7009 family protein n=1 Tax=Christiangramia antarctica TaxID=2058158 RepID=A0ABW5X3F4_9FLAO|nr:hypothetical protein [Gramella sp. AN32]MCM4155699.1 hypothetical protein [Gramella sp. AN32]
MKIRIRGNSVRFRLTKNEVDRLCHEGSIFEETNFGTDSFRYAVKIAEIEDLSIDFENGQIQLLISKEMLGDWNVNNRVGFAHSVSSKTGNTIDVLLEKDFTCLDERGEDESDNYPNPKANINHG